MVIAITMVSINISKNITIHPCNTVSTIYLDADPTEALDVYR